VKAWDDRGTNYRVERAWNDSDGHLTHGTYTFAPRFSDGASSLQLVFALEETDPSATSDDERLTPER
jgi:hypothetical protein